MCDREALLALVERWYALAQEDDNNPAKVYAFNLCADELASLLAEEPRT